MPDIDGYEVCRRLKRDQLTEDIPVLFVTSRANEPDEMAGFDAGGVDYISKPFSAAIVRARVRNHLQLVHTKALENSNRSAIYMLGQAGHITMPTRASISGALLPTAAPWRRHLVGMRNSPR